MGELAEATQKALDEQDFEAASTAMMEAIAMERERKNHIVMINLEMDLVPLLDAIGDAKRKNGMRRTIKKDRNDLFTREEKDLCAETVSAVVAESRNCETMDATLDLLEAAFQKARALLGEDHEGTIAFRTAIAQVYFDDGNYDSAIDELHEISELSFPNLRLLLECQIRVDNYGEFEDCYETLKELKERFGQNKKHGEEIEKVTAFVLYKDQKLEESLTLYKRMLSRPANSGDDRSAMMLMCGKVLIDLNQLDEALEMIQASLNSQNAAQAWFLMGVAEFKRKNYAQALEKLVEMGKILPEKDLSGQITRLHLEASIESEQKHTDESLSKLEQCVELCQKLGDSEEIRLRKVYDDIGAIWHERGDEEKTLYYFNLAHPEGEDDEEELEEEGEAEEEAE